MKKFNLLGSYPNPKNKRYVSENLRTIKHRIIASYRGKEFYDGKRIFGYGGFKYNPKFWSQVVKDIYNFYELSDNASILDIGCAKGFMLFDFLNFKPNLNVKGIDISSYAIDNSIEGLKKNLKNP